MTLPGSKCTCTYPCVCIHVRLCEFDVTSLSVDNKFWFHIIMFICYVDFVCKSKRRSDQTAICLQPFGAIEQYIRTKPTAIKIGMHFFVRYNNHQKRLAIQLSYSQSFLVITKRYPHAFEASLSKANEWAWMQIHVHAKRINVYS